MKKYALLILVAILFSFTTSLQPSGRHIIQLKIKTISTFEEAAKIDAFMSAQDGILASRTDHMGSTYFCFSTESKNLSEADFKDWFKTLGYEIGCFHKAIDGVENSVNMELIVNCKE